MPFDDNCKPPGIDLPLSALTEITAMPGTIVASLATSRPFSTRSMMRELSTTSLSVDVVVFT